MSQLLNLTCAHMASGFTILTSKTIEVDDDNDDDMHIIHILQVLEVTQI